MSAFRNHPARHPPASRAVSADCFRAARVLDFRWLVPRHCASLLVSGSSSAVERQLPKLDVAGSIPVSRSTNQQLTESGTSEMCSIVWMSSCQRALFAACGGAGAAVKVENMTVSCSTHRLTGPIDAIVVTRRVHTNCCGCSRRVSPARARQQPVFLTRRWTRTASNNSDNRRKRRNTWDGLDRRVPE
jgi:hypothetical protein